MNNSKPNVWVEDQFGLLDTLTPHKLVCAQCGREMNIVDYLINPVCLRCARKNQREVSGE